MKYSQQVVSVIYLSNSAGLPASMADEYQKKHRIIRQAGFLAMQSRQGNTGKKYGLSSGRITDNANPEGEYREKTGLSVRPDIRPANLGERPNYPSQDSCNQNRWLM